MATDWRWCWTPKRLKVQLPTFTTGFVLPSIKIVYYQHLLVSFEELLSLRLSDHFALVVGCINNNWLSLWKKDACKVFTGISPPLKDRSLIIIEAMCILRDIIKKESGGLSCFPLSIVLLLPLLLQKEQETRVKELSCLSSQKKHDVPQANVLYEDPLLVCVCVCVCVFVLEKEI